FCQLQIGDIAAVERPFSRDDLLTWNQLAGATVAHDTVPEPLIAALFSYLLGEKLPGHGTNYLKQSMQFNRNAMAGETLYVSVTVNRLRPEKALVNLDTICMGAGERII